MKPVNKRFPVTTPFGRKGDWLAGYHTGDDYACPVGTEVRNTKRGRVVTVGHMDKFYGNYVVVQSWTKKGPVRSYYCHLSSIRVRQGKRIKNHVILGLSGETGNATGPHLHYEERTFPFGYWNHRKPELAAWMPRKKK